MRRFPPVTLGGKCLTFDAFSVLQHHLFLNEQQVEVHVHGVRILVHIRPNVKLDWLHISFAVRFIQYIQYKQVLELLPFRVGLILLGFQFQIIHLASR